jgi:NAD(P)-dependent dehydrogenase (short-subunit alcohol dehydrogenase family)
MSAFAQQWQHHHLQDRRALVTSAASGSGQAGAVQVVRAGAEVAAFVALRHARSSTGAIVAADGGRAAS